jgi:hypothetical protein
MKMIGQQTETQVGEGAVIAVLVEDGRAAIAAIEDMVGLASELGPRNAGHWEGSPTKWGQARNRKSSLSPFLLWARRASS